MSKHITYTDGAIKSYTEDWAVKRLDKKRYILKNGLILTVTPLILVTSTHFREFLPLGRFLLEIVIFALMAFGMAYWNYSSREKHYQKFLKYQDAKQLENPKPGEYYN